MKQYVLSANLAATLTTPKAALEAVDRVRILLYKVLDEYSDCNASPVSFNLNFDKPYSLLVNTSILLESESPFTLASNIAHGLDRACIDFASSLFEGIGLVNFAVASFDASIFEPRKDEK